MLTIKPNIFINASIVSHMYHLHLRLAPLNMINEQKIIRVCLSSFSKKKKKKSPFKAYFLLFFIILVKMHI